MWHTLLNIVDIPRPIPASIRRIGDTRAGLTPRVARLISPEPVAAHARLHTCNMRRLIRRLVLRSTASRPRQTAAAPRRRSVHGSDESAREAPRSASAIRRMLLTPLRLEPSVRLLASCLITAAASAFSARCSSKKLWNCSCSSCFRPRIRRRSPTSISSRLKCTSTGPVKNSSSSRSVSRFVPLTVPLPDERGLIAVSTMASRSRIIRCSRLSSANGSTVRLVRLLP
jgi:hypothetical protein